MTVAIALGRECDCCRTVRWRTLTHLFVNGRGWQGYCGTCAAAIMPELPMERPDPTRLAAAWDRMPA